MPDNLFPTFENTDICWVSTFTQRIPGLGDGDILEFGAGSGKSTLCIAKYNPNRKVFTFDHFKGLEQTKKNIPEESGWIEGAFCLGHSNLVH